MRSAVSLVFLSVVLGTAGVLATVWAVVSLGRGELLTTLVVVGAAVFAFGLIAVTIRVGNQLVTVRVNLDDEGTTFRPDRGVDICAMTATVGMYVAMALLAIFAPLDMIDIPTPRGDAKYFVLTAIVGVLVGLPTMRQILTKRGMSYLRLDADGFEAGNTTSSVYGAWDAVTDVSDRPVPDRRPVNTGSTYITTTDGTTRLVATDWYTPAGHAMRDLVRFYWQHPECRDELTDHRAAERLRRVV